MGIQVQKYDDFKQCSIISLCVYRVQYAPLCSSYYRSTGLLVKRVQESKLGGDNTLHSHSALYSQSYGLGYIGTT
jgi:hypothetical protein